MDNDQNCSLFSENLQQVLTFNVRLGIPKYVPIHTCQYPNKISMIYVQKY